jgi:5'(3')-deoxyribonucleotidase
MSRCTFAIDVDEVLRSLLKNMVALYNENFGENLDVNDVKDFVVENSFPKIYETTGISPSKWFFQDHGEELFVKGEAFPGIKRDLDVLRQYGDVIIVTYQKTYQNKIDTLKWLEEHGLAPDGICFLKDKTLLHTDFLIDDNPYNFIGSNAVYGGLITAPYNDDEKISDLLANSNCREILRFSNLHEFCEFFTKNLDIYYCECCSRQR